MYKNGCFHNSLCHMPPLLMTSKIQLQSELYVILKSQLDRYFKNSNIACNTLIPYKRIFVKCQHVQTLISCDRIIYNFDLTYVLQLNLITVMTPNRVKTPDSFNSISTLLCWYISSHYINYAQYIHKDLHEDSISLLL